jgi:diguanylate cyclase (GGDEF)-like protein
MRWDVQLNIKAGLIISMVISLTLTPVMSFYMIRLFLEVDRLEEEMRDLATYDSLTGLLTRREFNERVNYFHKIAQRENLTYSLIIADLDNFKEINDQFGHQTGDQTLEVLGLAIKEPLRESDLACRYGGDEFTFFLPNTDTVQAKSFCERLQAIIQESISCSSLNINLTASIGIASYPENNAEFLDDMIGRADYAMYEVKKSGGNRSLFFANSNPL